VKFRVERDVLGEAVSWVARELPTRPVVPVLSGLLLEADETAGLTLSCFDYEVSARVVVPAEVGEPGAALVPGRLLAEITKSLPPHRVEVSSAADLVMLTCGSAEFALVSLPLAEYPKLPELPDVAGTVDGGALATAAAQVVPAASRDDTLPMLTGVCLDIDGDRITLAATDRYRLAVRTIGWEPAEPGIKAAALVPARTLADMARTTGPGVPVTIAFSRVGAGQAGGAPGDGPATGHRGDGPTRPADGTISFEGGGRRLTARLIGGEFIRYESRFPADFGHSAELPAGQFIEAVRRVSLVADRVSPVQLTFRPDTVVVEARSDGRARAVESVPAVFGGTEQAISFNPHYLLDGLAAAALDASGPDGAESGGAAAGLVRLDFTSPAKPALISWAGGASDQAAERAGDEERAGAESDRGGAAFRYLVVPLRAPAA
jgi:DNA polymerase III subunit beta